MKAYLDLLGHVLENGELRENRTGTKALSVFGYQFRHHLEDGFPLLTTKKMHWKSIETELHWFLRGETNNKYLTERGVTIWDEWATSEQTARFGRQPGDLGPVYGHQWRNFGATKVDGQYASDGFDQIQWLLSELRDNPASRRLIVTGWNPKEAGEVALPPCHTLTQFGVSNGRLSCHMYQRSADAFLGVPFNIASYALLTHFLVAATPGLRVGDLIISYGDLHIYENHLPQVFEQRRRVPKELPKLAVHSTGHPHTVGALESDNLVVTLGGYDPHPAIKAKVAV